METQPNMAPGDEAYGFFLEEITPVNDLNLTVYRLRHTKTGARMLHLACADENNLFAVGFRTPPTDSTGVAHILEHTVLCGSHRFPVRDPFFSMLKRSLNTFMNALTASDWTLYPFSSMNRKDFYNLMSIYLDATFFPALRERDFRQEGHRLEFADPTDPDSPLLFKGVVYNEMKGAMADPSSLLGRRLSRHLYPTTTYGLNSGGEPSDIPDLTWEGLRQFHAIHYHPSNAYILTYGNFPLETHLETIAREALDHFEAIPAETSVPPEKPIPKPVRVTETYPLDSSQPLRKRSMVQVGWLSCDINEGFDRLALKALSNLLLGNAAAPLYKALLDAKLGANLAPGTGYHDDNRTTYFAAGLQGTDPEETETIERLIMNTLEDVAAKGFPAERIDAVLHRMEFSSREVTGDSYPYPLILLMRAMGPWIHGGDPVKALDTAEDLDRLKNEAQTSSFFGDLIRRYLIATPHRITLTLRPDPEQSSREERSLAEYLEGIRRKLSTTEKERIVADAAELQKAQEAPEDLSCLPTLELADIIPEEAVVPWERSEEAGVPVYWFEQPTNGIGYFSAHIDTADLPEELFPSIPLFCALMTHIGAAGMSYMEMAERLEAGTGGIHFHPVVIESPHELDRPRPGIQVRSKALVRNMDRMFSILSDLFKAPDFSDLDRVRTVLNQMKSSLENSIPSSGHTYAARRGASTLTLGGRIREAWNGLENIRLVRSAADLDNDGLLKLCDSFRGIAGRLLGRKGISCSFTAERGGFSAAKREMVPFLASLPEKTSLTPPSTPPFEIEKTRTGWSWSVPVSYVAHAFRTVPYVHPDSGPLMVLARLMRAEFLHREIREKGGAYGGMASCDSEGGLFSLLSYRDPHIVRTLDVYNKAVEWACKGAYLEDSVKEAILAVFSSLDRPLSPGGKGQHEFSNILQGMTPKMRNDLRTRILAVRAADLARVASKYLGDSSRVDTIAVISGEKALEDAASRLNIPLAVEPI